MGKEKMFSLRISEKLLEEYRKFCDENSINISKRIRRFIEMDLERSKSKQKNNTQS